VDKNNDKNGNSKLLLKELKVRSPVEKILNKKSYFYFILKI